MNLETAGAVALVVSSIGGIIFAIYKLRPESTKIFVDSAKVSVELADAGRKSLLAELEEERAEHADYRKSAGAHMAELSAQLRAKKAELAHCEQERDRLKGGDKP